MKKLIALLLALVMVLALAACGTAAPAPAPAAQDTAPKEEAEPAPASVDNFPEKPLKVILGYSPGGGVDVSFRLLQPYLEKELGQPIEIVYREGASGQIAWTGIADATADGYTFGVYASPMLEFSILTQNPSYTIESFDFLGTYTSEPQIMLGQKNETRWSNVAELLAYAKDHPGEVTFSTNGTLNDAYLGLKIIEDQAGVEFNIIPFEGGNPARSALVGGHVDGCETQLFSAQSVWNDTEILAIVWEKNEYTSVTNAPTFNEATGLNVPNLGQTTGFILPAGVKTAFPERYEKLQSALEAAMANPDYIKALEEAGQLGKAYFLNAADTTEAVVTNMGLVEQYKDLFAD